MESSQNLESTRSPARHTATIFSPADKNFISSHAARASRFIITPALSLWMDQQPNVHPTLQLLLILWFLQA